MKIRPFKNGRSHAIARRCSGGVLAICTLALAISGVQAEPSGGTLVNNSALVRGVTGADIASVANGPGFDVTVTQNAARVVIDWTNFNIDAADAVHFDQLASNWIAVNRVTGGLATPTAINGMLTGAGHIWVLDPSGVAFGAGAIVDVGGLLATTSALDGAAFVAADPATGTFTFTEDGTGSVTNAATINAQGLIAMVAPVVENSGSLTSDNGDVLLGGAKAFRLRFAEADRTPAGGGAVYQELLVTDFIIDTGVDNAVAPAETIPVTQTAAGSARAGNIIISAASVGGGAFLNVDGVVEATNVGTGSGSVMLLGGADLVGGTVAATGTETIRTADLGITATGALTIQGSSVSIASSVQDITVGSATVNAVTGDASLNDAIVANVGGINVNAANGDVDAAAMTAATNITLSGRDIDLAGKADAATTAMLNATAGDISAVGTLDVEGSAVTLTGAALGGTGVRLISTGGSITAGAVTGTTGDVVISATGGNVTLGDVVATTGAIGIGAAAGGVDAGATTAGTSITISGQDIDLTGKADAATTAMLNATAGDISAVGTLDVEGSAVTLTGAALGGTGVRLISTGGSIAAGAITGTTGDVVISATGGNVTLGDVVATTGAIGIGAAAGGVDAGATTAGTSITISGQDIDLAGKADAATTAMLNATAGDISAVGTLDVEGSAVTLTGAALGGTGVRLISTGGSIAAGAITGTTGDVVISATGGNVTLGDVVATTGAIGIGAAAGGVDAGATTAGTSITISGQDIDLAGKADATTTAKLNATAGDISAVGTLDVEGSAVTLTGDALGGTGARLASTGGPVSVGSVTATTGNVAVSVTGGNATLDDVTALTGDVGISAPGGAINVKTVSAGAAVTMWGQDIDLDGKVTAGTLASLTAASGDVSSAGSLEIEAGSISLFGRVVAATDILVTALTGGIASTGSLTAAVGDILATAPSGPIAVNDLAAGNNIRLVGASVDIAGTATAQGGAFVQALTGNVAVEGSVEAAGGALVLNAANGTALLNRIGALDDVTLTVADLDLSGSITAGDQFILETARTGQTIVLGGDGSTGGVTLRRAAGLIIDEAELTKISAGRFDVDGGANDVLLLDARFSGASLDTLMIGADQSSRIIAAGLVTGLSSLQLGYQTGGIDRRPDLILVSGEIGLDTTAGRLGTVRLESSDDIVIGTEKFLEIFETGTLSLLGLASLPNSLVGGTTDHVFIVADQLQFVAPGSIVQLNTGRGVDGAGIVFGVPTAGDGVLFPSGTGPTEVLLFGDVIRADGSRVSGFSASLEDNILFGGNTMTSAVGLAQNDQYYMNFCLIGDPVSCSADSLREIERNNRFINGDPSGLGGVIPVVFETGEDDERNQEEDLGGVAASGNEALWDAGSQ